MTCEEAINILTTEFASSPEDITGIDLLGESH